MREKWIDALLLIWTLLGCGFMAYMICFPMLMKKKIARIIALLERIADALERKKE